MSVPKIITMKQVSISQLCISFLIFLGLQSCIGDDIIQDFVPEQVRILNAPDSIAIGESFQFDASFFNNVGGEEVAEISWSSSDEAILTIDEMGLATPIMEGSVVVTASIITTSQEELTDQVTIHVATEVSTTPDLQERAVTIRTTSSYTLEGTGTLKEVGDGDLILELNSDFKASSNLPGLYVYLTNNPNTMSGALEIGAVTNFNGAHSYTISATEINAYDYVLFYCKPFVVKVGDGELEK